MIHEGPIDLVSVDGRVSKAHRAFVRALTQLDTKEGREAARFQDPGGAFRDVTGQSMFKALRELEPGPIHAPLRDGLVRWVYELLQQRIGWELVLDEADAIHEPDPKLQRSAQSTDDSPIAKTFDEARRALILASSPNAADLAFERLAELAEPVAAVRKEERARRFEAARRLGLEHPWSLVTEKSAGDIEALARLVLDSTEALAAERVRDLRRRSTGRSAAFAIEEGFARDAREGWPAHLGVRWLEDVFRALAPRPPRIASLPPALGGASFVRAATEWGTALRFGGVARTLPFALARDPYPIAARVVGCGLGITVGDRAFAKRKLDLPARSADAHARSIAGALFAALRVAAAEVVAGSPDVVREDELEELGARVFGVPLPKALASAWSYGGFSGNARIEAPVQLVAAVRAHGFVRGLVDRFDEDWFDNPRAGAHLASIGAGPVWSGELPDDASVRTLARAFEEALG
jgi:hypothetical protein